MRESKNLSLREMSRRSGIDPSHLSKAERGLRGLSVDQTAILAAILGLRALPRQLEPFRRQR
jgi:transcriptional regulator with XRE-family HTH domain